MFNRSTRDFLDYYSCLANTAYFGASEWASQTRTVMRLMRYLMQQASYSSSQAAALSKENHMCIDFVPSIPYVVPHFFGYPPGGLNWTQHVFLFLLDGRAAKTKGCKGNGLWKKGTSKVVAATLTSPTTIKIWHAKDDPWEDRSSLLCRPPLWRPLLMNTSIISPASSCKKKVSFRCNARAYVLVITHMHNNIILISSQMNPSFFTN